MLDNHCKRAKKTKDQNGESKISKSKCPEGMLWEMTSVKSFRVLLSKDIVVGRLPMNVLTADTHRREQNF